ncbi:putative ErfK/YbiS/YcfS/YnhG protein [Magnetofaba australis IT-1]|uniref:Putative ErfK/YbiS/YcfS/YnhG protein n=2 Tax=Magnetofaba TaxID=1472292 RepID=A0A1Y2K5T1_9PROT|nr:putative ErfK/YbiS/YcfS/YnhG protein [Magnetofaba australis IT-1]
MLFCLTPPAQAASSAQAAIRPHKERISEFDALFQQGMAAIANSDFTRALATFEVLTRKKPDFRVAQLIYGDLLTAQAQMLKGFGNIPASGRDPDIADLQAEALARLRHLQHQPPAGSMPAELLMLSTRSAHAIAVDLTQARLYLFRNHDGAPELIASYYSSSGKNGADKRRRGDKKTPVGLYYITDYLTGDSLPDLYGAGALPLNYPNEWDRLNKRTGYGIWLHGTPSDTYSRPPRASDGCVALTNLDFQDLERLAGIGTPVVLSPRLNWVSKQEWLARRQSIQTQVEQWRRDLSSGDIQRLLTHYSRKFNNQSNDFKSWSNVLRGDIKQWSRKAFTLSDPSILHYPGKDPMVVVTFTESTARGGGQNWRLRRQYWRQEGGKGPWRIVYENIG